MTIPSVPADKIILHCDCNAFYASVECKLQPELKKVPMAVAGNPKNRHGIILAKNDLAKKQGVVTAETIWSARQKCPGLVLVPPQYSEYQKFSAAVNKIYQEYTDLTEPFGIDETFLDITGSMHLFHMNGSQLADHIRERVRKEIGITVSVGVSFNKVFAKLGSDYKKPDATTVISRKNYKEIVFPLPVSSLLFVGPTITKELSYYGVNTIGQLAAFDRQRLIAAFGKAGVQLHDYACGLGSNVVARTGEHEQLKSVGNGATFRRDLHNLNDAKIGISVLADSVSTRLRKHCLMCETVQLTIKDAGFKTISRQKKLDTPTYLSSEISAAALHLLSDAWNFRVPIRMLTVTGTNLIPASESTEQTNLFGETNQSRKEREKLEKAIDSIRSRYGEEAISTAAVIHTDII